MANTKLPARLLDTSAIPALNVTGDFTVDTTTLKVDSTNNRVGIGAAAPTELLHIKNPSNSWNEYARIRIGTETSDSYASEIGFHRGTSSDADRGFFIDGGGAGTQHFKVLHTGKVGIGDASPDTKLHVLGNVKVGSAASSAWAASIQDAGGLDVVVGSGSTGFRVWDDNSQSTPRFIVTRAGNVGIGPTSPSYKLDVGHVSSGEIQARFKSSGDSGYTQGAIVLESSDSASSPETRGQGVFMFNNGTDKTWYAGTLYSNPSSYGIGVVGGSTLQTSAADDGSSLAFVIDQSRNVGIGNPNPIAKLDLGVSGVSRNTTADVSTNAYMAGGSSSGGVQYPLTLGRDDNAATGHMIGMSFDFDDGNWSSTAALVAEVADASTAQTKLKLRTYSGGFKDGLTQHPFGGTTNNLQPGFFARGNTSQWLQGAASSWNTIVGGIAQANGSTIGVNLTEGASGHLNGYDPGGDFNTSNGRFTAPIAGRYLCHGSMYCAKVSNNVNDYIHFLVYVNGQQINQMYTMGGHKQGYPHDFSLNLSTVLNLDTSDYVEWKIYTTSTDVRIYGDHLCIGAHLIS